MIAFHSPVNHTFSFRHNSNGGRWVVESSACNARKARTVFVPALVFWCRDVAIIGPNGNRCCVPRDTASRSTAWWLLGIWFAGDALLFFIPVLVFRGLCQKYHPLSLNEAKCKTRQSHQDMHFSCWCVLHVQNTHCEKKRRKERNTGKLPFSIVRTSLHTKLPLKGQGRGETIT